MEKKELKRYLAIGFTVIGVCLVVKNFSLIFSFLKIAFSAAYPLILGAAIAYVFNIFLSFCEKYYFPKHKTGMLAYTRRPVCLLLSIAFTLAVMALILYIVIPELITAVKLISAEIPPLFVKLKDIAVQYLKDYPEIQEEIMSLEVDWTAFAGKALNFVKVGAGGIISSIAGFIGSLTITITNFVIAVIFAVYLLVRKDKLREDIRRTKNAYLNERVNLAITRVFHTANSTFKSFFVGQFTEAIVLGTLCMIGMSILKIPYAGMTGTVIGVTALIPIVGAYFGAAVGAFIICTDDPRKALIFLIFLVILQQFEGNVIYPKVVGSSIGLPGIWVLAGVTIGGGLFGIIGMLLGVPALATVYKLYHSELSERERKLGIEPPEVPEKQEKKKKEEKKPKKQAVRKKGK